MALSWAWIFSMNLVLCLELLVLTPGLVFIPRGGLPTWLILLILLLVPAAAPDDWFFKSYWIMSPISFEATFWASDISCWVLIACSWISSCLRGLHYHHGYLLWPSKNSLCRMMHRYNWCRLCIAIILSEKRTNHNQRISPPPTTEIWPGCFEWIDFSSIKRFLRLWS